ncbi:MAG: hypothetical protein WCX64_00005 [Candidatus Micrarchaeia archaeon]
MASPRNIRQKIHQQLDKDDDVENDADYLEAKRLSQMHMSEISIITDDYDDVFSDFDPRSFEVRELSDDFIREVKRASRQKGDRVELKIMVPKARRNLQQEDVILRRIRAHFKDGLHHIHKQLNEMRIKSMWYIAAGMVLMLLATYVSSLGGTDFVSKFLFVFFDPAGWFVFWTGLDILFVKMAEHNEDHEFYRKLASSEISFVPY